MPCALRISEAASLAMHALGYLANRENGPITTREIATRFEMSEAHLSKVLQRLVKVDLLRSIRGPKGGFVLTRPPGEVSLLEVFEAIEGPFEPNQCLLSAAVCDGETCILGKIVVEANEMVRSRLEATSLNQVGAVVGAGAPPSHASSLTKARKTGR
jgi:Rrf2 family protein